MAPSRSDGSPTAIGDALDTIAGLLGELEALKVQRGGTLARPATERREWPAEWDLEHFELTAERRQLDHGAVVLAHLRPRPEWATCGACEDGDERYTDERGYEFVRRCGCSRLRDVVDAFNAAGLPGLAATGRWLERGRFDWRAPAIAAATVLTRTPEGQSRTVPLRDYCAAFAADFVPGRRSLLVSGPPGTGKTHLVVGLAARLALRAIRTRFAEWFDYLDALKATFNAPGKTAADVRDPLRRAPLLVVDDLGRGTAKDWGSEEFARLLAPRLQDPQTTTLITTNLWPQGVPIPAGLNVETLVSRIGQRSMSRLAEACDVAVLVGEDQRTKHLAGGGR